MSTKELLYKIKSVRRHKCWVVTCLPCDDSKNNPDGCDNCGILDWWLAFDTEEECNKAYKEQHPDEFDKNGNYIGNQ